MPAHGATVANGSYALVNQGAKLDDPSIDCGGVDMDTPFTQKIAHVAVGEWVTAVPAHGQ